MCGVGERAGAVTHVVCGVDRGPEASPRGMLAVMSLATSKVVRAFLFANPVSFLYNCVAICDCSRFHMFKF